MEVASAPQRAPAAGDWLAGGSAVAVLTFEVEAEAPLLAEGNFHPDDISAMSHHAYEMRVGVTRVLELLGRLRVEATFFVAGLAAERWPQAIEAIRVAGHEIALHSHAHGRLTELTPEEQQADLAQGMAALSRIGVSARGYRAPYSQLTRTTLDLVAGAGFLYDSSLFDDDRPYRLRTHTGTLAELPLHPALDDLPQYAVAQPEPPSKVAGLWTAELDAMRGTRSLCVITCHPGLSGRPARLKAVERLVEFGREQGGVRFARADRVAAAALGVSL